MDNSYQEAVSYSKRVKARLGEVDRGLGPLEGLLSADVFRTQDKQINEFLVTWRCLTSGAPEKFKQDSDFFRSCYQMYGNVLLHDLFQLDRGIYGIDIYAAHSLLSAFIGPSSIRIDDILRNMNFLFTKATSLLDNISQVHVDTRYINAQMTEAQAMLAMRQGNASKALQLLLDHQQQLRAIEIPCVQEETSDIQMYIIDMVRKKAETPPR